MSCYGNRKSKVSICDSTRIGQERLHERDCGLHEEYRSSWKELRSSILVQLTYSISFPSTSQPPLLSEELNFPSNSTARTRGFQNLYRGLSRPHLLIWGEDGNGRLGVHPSTYSVRVGSLMAFDVGGTGGMPFPQKIDLMEVGHRYNAKFSAGGRTIDVGEGERVNLGVPVKLVAGGWSFHLLTSLGKVLYWGELGKSTAGRKFEN